MAVAQVEDSNGNPIPTLRDVGVRVNATAGASASAGAAIPANSEWVFVRCTDSIWLKFGTSSGVAADATSASALIIGGEVLQHIPSGTTHFSVLRVGSADVAVQLALAK